MHFHTSAIAALAALSQIIGVANAYDWDDNIGKPICDDIDDQGAIDLSNLYCAASKAELDVCNYMCAAQANGCQWGSKISNLAWSPNNIDPIADCLYHVQYLTAECATASNAKWLSTSARSHPHA